MAANTYNVVDWVLYDMLDSLLNKLAVASYFNTDANKAYDQPFPVGSTVHVELPWQPLIRDGTAYTAQGIKRLTTDVVIDQPFGIDFEWDSFERALRMRKSEAALKREFNDKAMEQLAQEIESRAALFAYQNTPNIVGVLGTDPTTFDATSAAARQQLVELGCPEGEKCCIVPPSVMRALKNGAIGFFNPVTDITKQFRTGIVGSGDGFEWYESVSLFRHTSGIWAGAVTLSSAVANGANTLAVTCTTGDTFLPGDVISIGAVNPVNPRTRRVVGPNNRRFVNLTSQTGVANAATLTVYPTIYGPGDPYQNVETLPANAAALTMFPGTAAPTVAHAGINGLAFHRDAFALVGVELEQPNGSVEICKQVRDPETGIAIRFLRQFDGRLSTMINRFDCYMGFGRLRPENCAVRILGA